jgi:hypothetical protein
VSRELQELQEAGSGGAAALLPVCGSSGRADKRRDPVAFRQRLAQRFAAKTSVYDNCLMYSQEGELLCHTGERLLAARGDAARGVGLCSQYNTSAALHLLHAEALSRLLYALPPLPYPLCLALQTARSFNGT